MLQSPLRTTGRLVNRNVCRIFVQLSKSVKFEAMQDQSEQRRKMIEHLEAAKRIADEIGESVTAYLIDCALLEARTAKVAN